MHPWIRVVWTLVTISSVMASTYYPNSSLQYFLWSTDFWVTIYCGEYSMDTLDFSKNAFIQRKKFYTIWITIYFCKYLIPHWSMSEFEHRVISLIRRIFLSIFVTCSRANVVLTSSRSTVSLIFSNYTFIRTRRVTKKPLKCNFIIFIRDLANCPAVRVCAYL